MTRRFRAAGAGMGMVLALAFAPAAAQTQAGTGDADAADIVVTAAGYAQRIVEAPASISVLDRANLE